MNSVAAACEEMHLLIQADIDGELDAAATAVLAAHIRDCPGCAALQRDMMDLSGRLRASFPSERAPATLRRALDARLALETRLVIDTRPALETRPAPETRPTLEARPAPETRQAGAPPPPGGWRRRLAPLLSFGGGAAIAASLMLLLPTPQADPTAELLASHIRALQPGHLTDVLSSDQHTVKPWFDGRIDYAPPVTDFAGEGFPLIGGRLDYLSGRAVAALVYRRDKHPIDLYVWPGHGETAPSVRTSNGYTIVQWSHAGMAFRAVSDLNAPELLAFGHLWIHAP